MTDSIVEIVTRGVFVLAFVFTLLDFARRRDIPRLELALLFGCLAPISVLQSARDLIGYVPEWLGLVAALAFLAHPFVLLWLLRHFRTIPRGQVALSGACLVASWAILISGAAQQGSWGVLAIVLAFAYVEGFATLELVRAAVASRGLSHQRLVAATVGSGCLALVIVLAGARAVWPAAAGIGDTFLDLLGLGSAVGYYLGFAPPRWLRRMWQRAEVEHFLIGLSGHSAEARVATALEYLGPAAARATGGAWSAVALVSEDGQALHIHVGSRNRAVLEKAGIDSLSLRAPALREAWEQRRTLVSADRAAWGEELSALGAVVDARAAMVAPLVANRHRYGLFVVLVERASPFVEDDLAVLEVLAEQAALAIDVRQLIEDNERERITLGAVMASMHDGLLVLDADNTVRYSNARADEFLGVASRTLHGSDSERVVELICALTGTADSVRGSLRNALSCARECPDVEVSLFGPPRRDVRLQSFQVADATGARRGIGLVLRDVTAERDLVRTKDELVSVVSHELRTPLASVVGFAELLRSRDLPEAQRSQFVTVIAEEGRRLTALINDFLDLQRMESGRQEIVARPVMLRPILELTVASFADDDVHPTTLDVPRGLPLVRIDPERIQQVLTNLLSNARKYSPKGGEIEISARETEGQVAVSVRDHGLGIPAEAQSRLFEKFYRVDNSDRREIKGTGLGLTISRKIVEAHGGRIWAESGGSGQGSAFTFTMPVAEERVTSGDVLVVEDDAGFARLLSAELANLGLSSVITCSVRDALEQLAIERPRGVVLDLVLPGADGEVFLRRLRAGGGDDIPVAVVTVKDLSADERAALDVLQVIGVWQKRADVAAVASESLARALDAQEPRTLRRAS